MNKMLRKYGSPIRITGLKGVTRMILVSDPDQVAEICENEEIFRKSRPAPGTPLGILRGDREESGLFTAGTEEEQWQIGRRILLSAFSLKSMRIYLPAINEQMKLLMDQLDSFGESYFDLPDMMTRMTYDSIVSSSYLLPLSIAWLCLPLSRNL